jgi:hypothetical protein
MALKQIKSIKNTKSPTVRYKAPFHMKIRILRENLEKLKIFGLKRIILGNKKRIDSLRRNTDATAALLSPCISW